MISINSSFDVPAIEQCLPGLLLLAGMAFCSGTYAAPPDTQVDVSYMFDDNVARAKQGGARLVDRSYSVNLSKPIIFPIADHARTLLTGSLGGEMFDHNKGLSRLTGAVQGELQYRSSAEFGTPVFAVFARVSADQYQSGQRDGFRYLSGISMQQTVTDRIRLFGAVAHNERNGKSEVFDNKDNSARISLDYSLGAAGTIYLGGEYRRGDLVISASELWGDNNSNAYTRDDAFSGREIYSFRFDGTTARFGHIEGSIELNRCSIDPKNPLTPAHYFSLGCIAPPLIRGGWEGLRFQEKHQHGV